MSVSATRERVHELTAIILSLSLTLSILLTALIPASAGVSQYQRSGLADREPAPVESSRLSLPRSEAKYGPPPAVGSAMPSLSRSSPLIAESRFNLDDEGWTVSADGVGPNYQASGGNPGGYLLASDEDTGSFWYWQAPAKFLGDISPEYVLTLSFDLMQSQTDSQADENDVILTGSGITLAFDLPDNPGTEWTSFAVLLHESAGWTNTASGLPATADDFSSALGGLTSLSIRGEYRFGPDSGGLDNVVLQEGLCPTGEDLIITSGMTCWLEAGTHTYASITVQDGGKIVLAGDKLTNTGLTVIASTITIETGGLLTADGAGYGPSGGPGAGIYAYQYGASGAGYGGIGGAGGEQSVGGSPYGSLYEPTDLGSGGGNASDHSWVQGGAGAGAIHLVVSDTLTVDGILSADGMPGQEDSRGAGGGSGGSIWIEAAELAGSGLIRSNGGAGSGDTAGGGAGGRIALDYVTNNHGGSVQAIGGYGYQYGGPGTVYWVPEDRLVVGNSGHDGAAAGLVEGSYVFTSIELANYGHLVVLGTGSSLTLTESNLSVDGTVTLKTYGALNVPAEFVIDDYTLDIRGQLQGATELTLEGDGELILHAYTPLHTGVHSFDSVLVRDGGILRLIPYNNGDSDYSNDAPFELHATTMTIETGGLLTADGAGYGPAGGPGAGSYAYEAGASGAGYGGIGGAGGQQPVGGSSYGSLYEPTDLGSGGGNASDKEHVKGGAGAGAIHLVVSGTLTVDGILSADGMPGLDSTRGAGGGSGGSIWIEAAELAGSGLIRANGGAGSGDPGRLAGGGAGGRIAVYSDSINPSITFSVAGGLGFQPGGDGTIYLDDLDPSLSTVAIQPTTVPTDGSSTATITVTLLDSIGLPLPEQQVEVALATGGPAFINGQPVTLGQYIDIGRTDDNGMATATIRAESAATRSVKARRGQQLISQHATVEFVPGNVDPANSSLTADKLELPADDATEATLTVTALDGFSNPIQGALVTLDATGGTLSQPVQLTDLNGRTSGTLVNGIIEPVTVTATIDGAAINTQLVVNFLAADLAADLWAPPQAIANGTLTYTLRIDNLGLLAAQDATAALQLPPEATYQSHTAPSDPIQDGNTLTWELGSLQPAGKALFTVTTRTSASSPIGTILTASLTAHTSTTDENPENDSVQAATTVAEAFKFEASLSPSSASLNMGGSAVYTVQVRNLGLVADSYSLSLVGLDPSWVTFSQPVLALSPGGLDEVKLWVYPGGCQTAETLPFMINVASGASAGVRALHSQVSLIQEPQIIIEAPGFNATSGSRSVLFRWRTNPATTGLLTVYPQAQPEQIQTFITALGSSHVVLVEDLERHAAYEWNVQADSTCGSGVSATHPFTVGSGIVFTNRSPSYEIDRDYNQIVPITVRNDDSLPHTLLATVQNPYGDLIINFVGSGSVDQTISLDPGQSRTLNLAIHAMDAEAHEYDLLATITADDGQATPLTDSANIHVRVLTDFDLSVTEVSIHPVTGVRTYEVWNNGHTVSDLGISAVDPATNEPARIYFQPIINHARLETDQSLAWKMIPLFDERDVTVANEGSSSLLASMLPPQADEIPATLIVSAAGQQESVPADMSCSSGRVYGVTLNNVCMEISNTDSYCTNSPEISVGFELPYFIDPDDVTSVDLHTTFDPRGAGVLPHSTSFDFNGVPIGGFTNLVPSGTYSTGIPVSALNSGSAGPVAQQLNMSSDHSNGGHYMVATDFTLGVSLSTVTAYVCAGSPEQARQSAMETYGFESISSSSACSGGGIPAHSIWSKSNEICDASQGATATAGGPINTFTGGMDYSYTDLSIPTSAGPLTFTRWYASLATDTYTAPLGYGWTHSLDTRLIFEDDPQGMQGKVLLKVQSANLYEFTMEIDGSYTAFPGLCGTLTQNEGSPVTYTFTDSAQRTYTFDEFGHLITLANSEGRAHHYSYDAQGRLERVSDDSGSRYLSLAYDGDGRLVSVSDHSGRQVGFSYDANGNLAEALDALGQAWTYTYDPDHAHLLSQVIDPRGAVVEHTEYDQQGRAVRQYNGEGELVVELIYDGMGVNKVIDGRGNESVHIYGPRNTIDSITNPLGGELERTYDDNFRPTRITNEGGHTTQLAWSSDGTNLTEVVDPAGNRTGLTYDDNDNLTSVTDPSGAITSFTYDGTLLTGISDPLGGTTSYSYTPEGFLTSVIDARGGTTSFTYDAFGQLTSMTDALGSTWLYRYDGLGRVVESEDTLGHVTHSEYDAAGRLLRLTRNYDPARPQNDQDQYNIITEFEYDAAGNLISVTDTYGRTTRYEYDTANRLLRSIDALGNTTENTYGPCCGQLASMTDPLGRTTSFEYDALGRLVLVTDALGGVTTGSYDARGNLIASTDPLGNTTHYEYDSLERLVRSTDALGNVSTNAYDSRGNLAWATDPLGHRTTYVYDALNRLVSQTDPAGEVTRFEYDAAGNLVLTVDANGGETRYEYDALNRLLAVTDALDGRTTYAYDALGNLTSMTDPLGNTITYQIDAMGRTAAWIDPLGQTRRSEYDALGLVLASTDPDGRRSSYEYDALGRLLRSIDPLGGVTSFAYDAVGNTTSFTNPLGQVMTTAHDALNRPVSFTDPLGAVRTTAYDALGNVVSFTDPTGAVTTFEYDPLGRQVRAVDPLGNISSFEYDARGNRAAMVDPNGVTTRYEYDTRDRLAAVVENYLPEVAPNEATNVRTEYTYNALGNRLTIRDANDNLRHFAYDALGRLVSETDPLGNVTLLAYDSAGNRVAQTDAAGFTTNYEYDAAGRLMTIDLAEPDTDVRFAYDASGSRVEMLDGLGTTHWVYDALGRPTTIVDPFGAEVGYGYDAGGNRTGMTYPDGRQVSYEYDPASRLAQVTDWSSFSTTYGYDLAGRLASVALPNGVVSSYNYDAAGRLAALAHSNGGEALSSYEYSYDPAGNRTRLVESMLYPWAPETAAAESAARPVAAVSSTSSDPILVLFAPLMLAAAFAGRRRTWRRRMIVILLLVAGAGAFAAACTFPPPIPPRPTATPTPALPPTATLTPTAVWTPTEIPPTATATSAPTEVPTPTPTPLPDPVLVTTTIDYGYDPLGRLISADYDTGQIFHYAYDPVGNRLTQETLAGVSNYSYDAANRLVELDGVALEWDVTGNLVRDQAGASYGYDHQNRLTSVETGGSTFAFAYNGLGDRVQQIVNGVTSTYALDLNTWLTQVLSDGANAYLYGLGRIGEHASAGWQYHLGDALGSVRQLANEAGAVVLARAYQPFGSPLDAAGHATTSYGFTGEWTDATGLVHLRARYYQPEVGRFFQPDPFSGLDFQPRTTHPYLYAFNNPLRYSDPSGQFAFIPLILIAAAGGFLGGLSYYALQPLLDGNRCWQWDWGEAILWSGVGTTIGVILGVSIYGGWWVGTRIGWLGSGPTIVWLENQVQRVQHIMDVKHAWNRIIQLTNDVFQDYLAIRPYLAQVMNNQGVQIGTTQEGYAIMEYVGTVQGEEILVRALQMANDLLQIVDAWVITK